MADVVELAIAGCSFCGGAAHSYCRRCFMLLCPRTHAKRHDCNAPVKYERRLGSRAPRKAAP